MESLVRVFGGSIGIDWLFPIVIKRKLILEYEYQLIDSRVKNELLLESQSVVQENGTVSSNNTNNNNSIS